MPPVTLCVSAEDSGLLAELVTEYIATWGGARRELDDDEVSFVASLSQESHPQLAGWVAIADGYPCGCVLLLPGYSAESVELAKLFVLPAYRRLGVARVLVETAHAWSREHGYTRAYLIVQDVREEAISLYQRAGYKDTVVTPIEGYVEMC